MNIGLTGGMGCGKTLVLSIFRDLGTATIESDAIVRNILASDEDVKGSLRRRFGDEAIGENGEADRKVIASRVFANEQELRWLEELLHPRVRQEWTRWLAARQETLKVVEIPLLFEKNLEKQFDMTVCVSADPTTQVERLAQRGFTAEQARERMARQLPLEEKEKRASRVISNNGHVDFTRAQVAHLVSTLKL